MSVRVGSSIHFIRRELDRDSNFASLPSFSVLNLMSIQVTRFVFLG